MPKGHKDSCLCVVCQQRRKIVAAAPAAVSTPTPTVAVLPPPSPTTVRLDSLEPTARFELGGEKYLVKEEIEGVVVCCNLFANSTVTLAGFTMVKPII